MEDFFRYYFYLLLIPVGWVIFNESIDSITRKLFGRKIQNIEDKKIKIQKNTIKQKQKESDLNYQKIGIKIDDEELRTYFEEQVEAHNECMKNFNELGYYVTNLEILLSESYGNKLKPNLEYKEEKQEHINKIKNRLSELT
tara:strand:- start:1582 stop:2004 length:423 start_codon:yes stop_codon:yes gene_type:complete